MKTTTKIDREFEERLPKLEPGETVSEIFEFGYKYQKGSEIYEVTDWGNIKKFLHHAIDQATQEAVEAERARMESLIPEKMKRKYGGKRGNLMSEIKRSTWNEAISIMQEAVKK